MTTTTPESLSTINIAPANGGGTITIGFISLSGFPNNDAWETSGSPWSIDIQLSSTDGDIDVQGRWVRLNSSGSVLQTGSFTTAQDCSTNRTVSPTVPTWTGGEEDCGNRLAMELLFTNNAPHGNHSVDLDVDTSSNRCQHQLSVDSGGCAAAAGPRLLTLLGCG